MRRWIAVLWHASFLVLAGVLYFFFVLPRWYELTGAWPVGLGSAMRLVCGALIGLAALPVLFTLLKTRKPEFGTPQLALTLRTWSVILHVLAGALIFGAALTEFWVSLDTAGATLFGIYGAAAAIALLGALGFYLAYAAELPPPPPKPLKPKTQTRRRRRSAGDDDSDSDSDSETIADDTTDTVVADETTDTVASDETVTETTVADVTPTRVSLDKSDETTGSTELVETSAVDDAGAVDEGVEPADLEEPVGDEPEGKLRNRRPNGKPTSRLFGRSSR